MAPAENMNDMKIVRGHKKLPLYFGSLRPRSSITAAPNSGNSGMSQMLSRKFIVASPLQQVDLVGEHRALVAEQGDQNAQPHRRFGHRDGDDEDCENLPAHVADVLL